MRILIADDDEVSRCKLEALLSKWGYEVISVEDGTLAWEALQQENAPRLTILDWMMPGLDGSEICRQLRQSRKGAYVYVLLLTSKVGKEDIVAGMEAGEDDYLGKPFNAQELKVRLRAGKRIVDLEEALWRKPPMTPSPGLGTTGRSSTCWSGNWPAQSVKGSRPARSWWTWTTSNKSMIGTDTSPGMPCYRRRRSG